MNIKLKCLLLDDELPSLTYLKSLCEQIPDLDVVRAFNSSKELLKELPNLTFDLLISDIEMPEINGIQLARLLQGKSVIFTTAYTEYAIDAFDMNAVDYLKKPLKLERLKQAIAKARQLQHLAASPQKNYIQLNTARGKTLLYFDQIAYIQTSNLDSRDKVVRLLNGMEMTLKNISFKKLGELLPATLFCQINKKELLALSVINSFSHDEIISNIILEDSSFKTFTLGDIYKTSLLERISL